MAETPAPSELTQQLQRLKCCKAKAGKLATPAANHAIQNIGSATSDEHFWKDPQMKDSLRRGIVDMEAKVAFRTLNTVCLPSQFVVLDDGGTCGYLIGVDSKVADTLSPDHPVLQNALVLPDLTTPTILLVLQPCLEIDFLGRIKKLNMSLPPLSDLEVAALFGECLPALVGLQVECVPFLFDQSAESRRPSLRRLELPMYGLDECLLEEEIEENMVYVKLDGGHDAWDSTSSPIGSTPPSNPTVSTPKLRPLRRFSDSSIDLAVLEAKYLALPPNPRSHHPGPTTASRFSHSTHKDPQYKQDSRATPDHLYDGITLTRDEERSEASRSASPAAFAVDKKIL
ncbi:hypothetical protein FRC01_010110 [Tulasnella sp. 417]|nr:hypothetical protein FRC01_010110 [Tulasnella sp. 417]